MPSAISYRKRIVSINVVYLCSYTYVYITYICLWASVVDHNDKKYYATL